MPVFGHVVPDVHKLTLSSLEILDRISQNFHMIYRHHLRYSPAYPYCNIQLRLKMPGCWMKVTLQILPQISCHGNVPKGIKKRSGSKKFTQFIWWKDRESWDNLSQVKKKKLWKVKYIALSASLPSGLNNWQLCITCRSVTIYCIMHCRMAVCREVGVIWAC